MNRADVIALALRCRLGDGSVDIIDLASRLGVSVYGSEECDDFNAEITHIPSQEGFEILVNTSHTVNRQRFSIAHELAHYVLHKDRIEKYGSLRRAVNKADPSFDPEIEKQADELAEELLIPEELLKQSFSDIFKNSSLIALEQIQEIAQKFKVSVVVAALRLKKLGHEVPYVSFSYA